MSSPDEGIVYIATGRDYIEEACLSAKSLREHNEDVHVTIFSDQAFDSPYFDRVRPIENPEYDFGDSVIDPEMTPYDRTLFLDTDTYVCEDITGMFDILERFDIAASHNPGSRNDSVSGGYTAQNVPDAFPLYNTGVLLFADTPSVRDFFTRWSDIYERAKRETGSGLNQPAFREALYHSALQIGTLPSEYNLRVHYDGSVGFMTDSVKIVHGRHPAGLPKISDRLNEQTDMRVFSLRQWPLEITTKHPSYRYYLRSLLVEETKPHTFRGRLYSSLKDRGFRETVSRVARDVKNASPL